MSNLFKGGDLCSSGGGWYFAFLVHSGQLCLQILNLRADRPSLSPLHCDVSLIKMCVTSRLGLFLPLRRIEIIAHLPSKPACVQRAAEQCCHHNGVEQCERSSLKDAILPSNRKGGVSAKQGECCSRAIDPLSSGCSALAGRLGSTGRHRAR